MRFRLEQQEEELKEGVIFEFERKTEKVIEQEIYADQDFWRCRWEDFTECLASILDRKSPDGYWKAQVRNFGWRNLDGIKFLQAGDGASFLRFGFQTSGKSNRLPQPHRQDPPELPRSWHSKQQPKFSIRERNAPTP